MTKKKLNTGSITNELEGASLFFTKPHSPLSTNEPEKPQIRKEVNPLADSTFFGSVSTSPTNQSAVQENDLKSVKNSSVRKQSSQKQSSSNLPVDKKNDNVGNNASSRASVHASTLASIQDDIVETIRKTVKQVGKDTLFVRLTPGEKHQVASVVYALNEMYRGESRKTSENEIGRIGVNFILEDYKANGKESILAKALAALNA